MNSPPSYTDDNDDRSLEAPIDNDYDNRNNYDDNDEDTV